MCTVTESGLLKGDDSLSLSYFNPVLPDPRKSLQLYGDVKKAKFASPNDSLTGFRFGPQLKDSNIHFVSHDESVYKRGLLKRCAHDEHPCSDSLRLEFFKFAKHRISRMRPLEGGLDRQKLLDEWLDNSNYNGKRRNELRRLNEAFYSNDHEVLKGPQHPSRMYELNSFIKREFYLEPKEARIINSRSDVFKAVVGPYIHALEHLVYDEHFIKHCTPKQVVERMNQVAEGYSLFYETDYSSFEGSFDKTLLRMVEKRLLSRLLWNYPEVRQIVCHTYEIDNVLRFKRKLAASFRGSRMSGEMWTSMCNGFMNKMLVEFMAKKAKADVNYLVEGDDGFIATNKELDVSIVEKLGFKLKFDTTTNPRNISFCSLRVCEDKLVPDIKRTLAHYGSTCDHKAVPVFKSKSKRALRRQKEYIRSKALSLLTVARGMPILQAVAVQQLSLTKNVSLNIRYVDWWEKTFFDLRKLQPEPVTMKIRRYVAKRFHIPVAKQIQIEQHIMRQNTFCYDIDLDC